MIALYASTDARMLTQVTFAVENGRVWKNIEAAKVLDIPYYQVAASLHRLQADRKITMTHAGRHITITLPDGRTTARRSGADGDVDMPGQRPTARPVKAAPEETPAETEADPENPTDTDPEETVATVYAALFTCLSEGRAFDWQDEAARLGIDPAALNRSVLELCNRGLVALAGAADGGGITFSIATELTSQNWSAAA